MLEYLNKRDFYRMEVEGSARLKVQGEDATREARVKDLSATGVLLWANEAMASADSMAIEIPPGTDITPPFHALLNVVRCAPLEEGSEMAFSIACTIEKLLTEEEAASYFS
ncbi:PilZ domain-containing protein [Solemya velesiana gill symbiont]|uniref:PilZ domain-containing protein n=1 Tax=Solemya velesiana gill symbiont TaxID=1918948 RepID=A0A1T2KXV6_9GAMM|nr:PilZ domain-containing protein [Solemya velesiana gill symbiont]OOZ37600.1 hypothetical protein BOW51_01505 [Solemya velesiana gill symbiont]